MPMTMPEYLEEARARAWAFLVKRFGRWPIIGITVFLVVALARIFFEAWVTRQWAALGAGWRVVTQEPVGFFGFWLFVGLAALVLLSFVDTSPVAAMLKERLGRAQAAKAPIVTLTSEEKETVQKVRVFWSHCGDAAAHAMSHLFEAVLEDLPAKVYWREFLNGTLSELLSTSNAMTQALDGSQVLPLVEVIRRFNAFYAAYSRAAKWLHRIDHYEFKLATAPPQQGHPNTPAAYSRWRTINEVFQKKLWELDEWPELKPVLKILMLDEGAIEFVQRHGDRPSPSDPHAPLINPMGL